MGPLTPRSAALHVGLHTISPLRGYDASRPDLHPRRVIARWIIPLADGVAIYRDPTIPSIRPRDTGDQIIHPGTNADQCRVAIHCDPRDQIIYSGAADEGRGPDIVSAPHLERSGTWGCIGDAIPWYSTKQRSDIHHNIASPMLRKKYGPAHPTFRCAPRGVTHNLASPRLPDPIFIPCAISRWVIPLAAGVAIYRDPTIPSIPPRVPPATKSFIPADKRRPM